MTSERAVGVAVPAAVPRAGGSVVVSQDMPVSVDGAGSQGAIEVPSNSRAGVTIDGEPFPIVPHHCFACGSLNTEGLGLALHVDGEVCWTEVTLPARFEGWQGIAHGGIVCTILDEVMAWALAARDSWSLTARMTVEFKRPVPVGHAIRAEGRLTRSRRRLMETSARLSDAATGELLATAEALYVTALPDQAAELKQRYGFAPEARSVAASDAPPATAVAPSGAGR